MRNAMNEVTRGSYVRDCELGVKRWNRLIEKAGLFVPLVVAQHALSPQHRKLGRRADGSDRAADQRRNNSTPSLPGWLPSESDRAYIMSLMHGVHRARQDGSMDRASRSRHQQQSGGLRIRKAALKQWLGDGG